MPIKVSQLPELTVIDGTVVVPVIDNSISPVSKKSTIANIASHILSGNAATATKLATARNINGVAFDGTANITITTSVAAATTTVIGGVIVGSGINVGVDGTISVATIGVATTSTAGTVIVGNGLQVEVDGTLSTTTTPSFHGFVVNANGDLEYTKMTSGDLAVANGDATEQYVMWEIGTSDYNWKISADGLLQIEYTDSDI
jgi:hypothetical protein